VDTYGKDIEGEIIPLSGFDVTSKDHITKLVKEVESREECLCILVNNAGISSNTVTTETDSTPQLKKNLFDAEGVDFQDWINPYSTNVAAVYFTSGK
jgi:NAD(P)-dependent dehydrogenase (short-subunit alcohol dehydrogenase family)